MVGAMLEFKVLGAFEVHGPDGQIELPTAMLRRLAAVLSCYADRPVSLAALADDLWAGLPPASAHRTLIVYIHRLRRVLGEACIKRTPGGYQLDAAHVSLDARIFADELAGAATEFTKGRTQVAINRLEAALQLWRGPAYMDIDGCQVVAERAAWWSERYLDAVKQHARMGLGQGRHREVLATLASALPAYPYDEDLHGLHMMALYRSGRQSDALAQYRALARRLNEELGIEPGAELAQLHQQILRGDSAAPPPHNHTAVSPSSLPRDIPGFVGRVSDLSELDRLAETTPDKATAILVTAVTGAPGVGKTGLCLHWAHERKANYPDGQIYIDLRGHDEPIRSIDALGALLREVGVAAESIPLTEIEAVAAYRTAVAGRQMLLLLDNAASAEQVRPLLPASPGSLALITSRNRLAGLVARDDARRLTLRALTETDAVELLVVMLGSARCADAPEAVRDLAKVCGYLPLALRIAAADLADRADTSVADYVDKLSGGDALEALHVDDDDVSSVRVVFEQAYSALAVPLRRVFRLLGHFAGTHLTLEAAAALLGVETSEAHASLAALSDANLVEERRPGRYGMHDLLRQFAVSHPDGEVNDTEAALLRLTSWLQERAESAHLVISGMAEGTVRDSMEWMDEERFNLIEAVSIAISRGWTQRACDLAQALWRFFHHGGYTSDWINTFERVLGAAEGLSDRKTSSFVMNSLGGAYIKAGRYDQAIEILQSCIDIRIEIDDLAGAARSCANLSLCYEHKGHYEEALIQLDRALTFCRAIGDTFFEVQLASGAVAALHDKLGMPEDGLRHLLQSLPRIREIGSDHDTSRALANIACLYVRAGKPELAMPHMQEAHLIRQRIGDRYGLGLAYADLGTVYRALGDFDQALEHLVRALPIIEQAGMRAEECEALNELAATHADMGDRERALAYYERALALSREIGVAATEAEALAGIEALSS